MSDISCRALEQFKQQLTLLSALGDAQRQNILIALASGPDYLSVAELTAKTKLSRPAISHHLKILKQANLLDEYRDGMKRYYIPKFRDHLKSLRIFIDTLEKLDKTIQGELRNGQ